MKRLYINLSARNYYHLLSWSLLLCIIAWVTQLKAQQTQLVCNTYTPVVSATAISAATPSTFASLSVTSSTRSNFPFPGTTDEFSNKNNLIDGDLTNFASWAIPVRVLLG